MKRIMKKTYINPEVEVVEMQMAQAMMDVSGPSISNDEVTDMDDLLKREFGGGLWD